MDRRKTQPLEPTDTFGINPPSTEDAQNEHSSMLPPRSLDPDGERWRTEWRRRGQPWRVEPEIALVRQAELAAYLLITPNIERGIYPFQGQKLSRADVEWLLATHEDDRGPVDWGDSSQSNRLGLDLRGADLRHINLRGLPLDRLRAGLNWDEWSKATAEQRQMAGTQMDGCNLEQVHLRRAYLRETQLARANLGRAHMEEAHIRHACLRGASLERARLEGADLRDADLRQTNLKRAQVQGALFDNAIMADEQHIGPQLADVSWSDTNLTVIDWTTIAILGDEYQARSIRTSVQIKNPSERLAGYRAAVRANRQIGVVLQAQGLNEDAQRFAYRALKLRQAVMWRQGSWGQYCYSLALDLLSGYGYRPTRSLVAYLLVIALFMLIYRLIDPPLAWSEAFVVSMTAFHGRGFSPSTFVPGDALSLAAAVEAFVGLIIEVTFIATLTQRFFGK